MEIFHPETKEEWLKLRTEDITSTDCAALFGLSPYKTKFQLWHEKKSGDIATVEENQRMKWGKALERAIAEQVASERGWIIRPMKEYIRNGRAGSSFDFFIENANAILEVKNVDGLVFKRQWVECSDGTYEAPDHIELQVQHQMMVAEKEEAYICVLVDGCKEVVIYRKRDESIIAAIRKEIDAFWASIEANEPPEPNFSADAAFIASLNVNSTKGKTFDASGNERINELIAQDGIAAAEIKKNESIRAAVKAELLTIIGDADRVDGDGFTISCGTIAETEVAAFTKKAFRMVRINRMKEK